MKTIKERAKEYSLKDFDGYYTGRESAVEEGYIAGAKEQKEIDIDKACKWFEGYLAEIGYPDDWCRDSEVQESGEKRFRKFMDANTVDDGIDEGEALLYTANKVAERTRKEMIDKACKWMCKYCPAQNDKENGLQECEGTEDSCCHALDSLRNFMTSE